MRPHLVSEESVKKVSEEAAHAPNAEHSAHQVTDKIPECGPPRAGRPEKQAEDHGDDRAGPDVRKPRDYHQEHEQ